MDELMNGTTVRVGWMSIIAVVAACGVDPEGQWPVGGDAATTDAPAENDATDEDDTGPDGTTGGDDEDDGGVPEPIYDVFGDAGDDGEGTGGTIDPGCIDNTAEAALLLTPCDDWRAEFHAPFDASYECRYATPEGYLIGDTDITFAYDDPDVLLVGRWDGGITSARVTRDADCNITGFVDAQWQPVEDNEPADVFVRGMTFLDDGTMFIARSIPGHPQQVGQRVPGSADTALLVDSLSVLPPWEQLFYGNENVIVSLTVVPSGFPGAGELKVLAEKLDTSHWFTVPLSATGDTYDLGTAVEETSIHPPEDDWGGYYARGMAWVAAGNAEVDVPSVLVPEAWHYTVALYELDPDGNPRPDTRIPFVEGLGMPSGAETDAISGNNFVFTGRRSQDVYVVRGPSAPVVPPTPRG